MKKLFGLLFALVALSACDSNDSGEFAQSHITTDFGEYTSTNNTYSFVEPANPGEISQSFTLLQNGSNSLQFSINYLASAASPNGVYSINNNDSASAPFAQGAFLHEDEVYVFASGTIALTKINANTYKAVFDITAQNAFNPEDAIHVEGSFKGTISEY